MANRQRHRIGTPEIRTAPVLAATVIEVGDMLWYDASNNCVKPASDYTWDTDLATTQGTFKDVFIGIAIHGKTASQPAGTIAFGTRGQWEMDCASAAFDMATFLGPAKQSGNALENQKVVAVANATLAIGKPGKQTATGTTVYTEIASSVLHSGVQTIT